jgi:chloramphenicol O-acetyltransferase
MRNIDPKTTARAHHFEHFRTYDLPYTNLTAPVELTELVTRCRAQKGSLFAHTLFAISRAANQIEELRQRIQGDQIIEYDAVHPAFTTLLHDNTIRFCPTPFTDDRETFIREVERSSERAKDSKGVVLEPHVAREDLLYVSAIPWLSFTSIQHPARSKHDDSVPRIAWGKVTEPTPGKYQMPLSLQVHHALVDGLHMARFFEAAEKELAASW